LLSITFHSPNNTIHSIHVSIFSGLTYGLGLRRCLQTSCWCIDGFIYARIYTVIGPRWRIWNSHWCIDSFVYATLSTVLGLRWVLDIICRYIDDFIHTVLSTTLRLIRCIQNSSWCSDGLVYTNWSLILGPGRCIDTNYRVLTDSFIVDCPTTSSDEMRLSFTSAEWPPWLMSFLVSTILAMSSFELAHIIAYVLLVKPAT
jgi:hypothetical protein